ncbi:hypothetical protein BsWGS_19377 [Bradybaena similaris]
MSLQITGEASIEILPDHILVEIMRYLSMKDRCRAARVCKQWNDICSYDSLWRHVDLLKFRISLTTLWRLVRTRFSRRMSTLKLRGFYHNGGGLTPKESLSNAVLKRIAACCPNLQVLHLKNCRTENISFKSLPTSIVCLEIVNCYLVPGWMAFKQKHLPKLEHLNLDRSECFDDADMCYIIDWRNLKYLSITNCDGVGNDGIITIANYLYELEYLSICLFDINDDAVYHIAQHLKKLRQLCLAECIEVTDKGIVEIARGLPMLDRLDISYCQVTMRGLKTLFGSNIRELIAVGLTELSNNEKQALKMHFAVTRFH